MLETTTRLRFGHNRWFPIAAKPRCCVNPVESLENRSKSANPSNLDRFLASTNFSVPAKMSTIDCEVDFVLDDLWETFQECSAYGAGVSVVLDGCGDVVQYYVPYLSGIQLYGELPERLSTIDREFGDSDDDSYRDSSSDRSSDWEHEETLKGLANSVSLRKKGLSEDSSSDDGDSGNPHGYLLFEYLEQAPPFIREPLADKIADLARQFPALRSLRSSELLPSSWFSVSWYPIYRIPTGPTLKDLDACFLTFHPLSTRMKGASGPVITYPKGVDAVPKVSLPTFGLACYKFKSSIWTPNERSGPQRASSLLQVADNWLRLLNVDHPDYRFFTSHGYGKGNMINSRPTNQRINQ